LAAQNIVFQPGVNEELGATAVWGTQQLDLYPQKNKFDGVFGIWYGKGAGGRSPAPMSSSTPTCRPPPATAA